MLNTTLRYSTLRYITLHYTALHYATLHYTTLHYPTLHCTALHYTTLHYTTLHYTTLHCTALHYTTLHYPTLHYTTLRYTALTRTHRQDSQSVYTNSVRNADISKSRTVHQIHSQIQTEKIDSRKQKNDRTCNTIKYGNDTDVTADKTIMKVR